MVNANAFFQSLMVISLLVGLQPAWLPRAEAAHSATPLPSAERPADIPETYQFIAENDSFQLYANPETLAFKVVDRRSGYIWHSNLDERADGDRLNRTWTAFASSGISIDFLDQKAISVRASVTNAERVIETSPLDQGIQMRVTFTEPSITLAVNLRLEAAGVSVEVPFDLIREDNPDFKLGLLYVYPFLGATRGDQTPGYMFIPDGCGSLIHFQAETKAQNMFYGQYYGDDLGILTVLPYDPDLKPAHKISIPVFGMVHGEQQNAFISIVEKGASYGEIQAHPSGIITNFNFIYSTFLYNQSYFQATNRSGAGVTTLQKNTNAFDVKVHYRFLAGEESNYVGMAQSYQQYLIEMGALHPITGQQGDIGVRLEFLGGEKEKVLIWQRAITMTTLDQMAEILVSLDVQNPDVVYYGWQPLGASAMPPTTLKLEGALGSLGQLRSLAEEIAAGGGHFYLYLDPQAALWGEGGYSARNDLAMSITNANLIWYNRNKANYYFNLETLRNRFTSLQSSIAAQLSAGLAIDGLGSILYSDFKSGHFLNREDAIEQYAQLLAESDSRLAFYLPNAYVFSAMSAYYDIPLSDSGYIYTTETVPFLQIVLAGYVPYFGAALNFSSNGQDDLLRHVDFGVYPSYFLSYDRTAKILNTSSNWIYSSSYEQWGDEIERTYQWLNSLLAPVQGQEIVARQMLAPGVAATTYANGQQIVVNYSDQPFSAGDFTVNAKDAAIREVLP